MKKSEIIARFKRDLAKSKRGLSAQYDNTEECIAAYNGNVTSYKDSIEFNARGGGKKRAVVEFGKIKPNVDAVVGFMAQNRSDIKYLARTNSALAGMYSKYMNAISDYVRENAFMDHIETEQDLDMLVNGYGATETDISYIYGNYTTDPNGEIIKVRLDPTCVGWSPTSRQKNVIDSPYVWYYKDMDLKDAVDLMEEDAEDFERVGDDDSDTGYRFNPYGGVYDKIKDEGGVEWASEKDERVRIYNYEWFEFKNFYRADNPLYATINPQAALVIQGKLEYVASQVQRGEYEYDDMFEFDPRAEILTFDDSVKGLLLEQFGDIIAPVKFKRKCYYTAIISGETVFKSFKSLSQQGFSVKFKTGTFDAHNKIWVGMVNGMINPVKYYSKAITELLFTIASNSKGGVMVERSAVEDINDFSSKWAKTDAVIVVNDGTITQGRVQEKARAQVPTGLEGFINLADAAIADVSGIDRSFLGAREATQESGIMYRRRIKQIITTMARYMDSITMYRKQDARMMADYIRAWVENNDGSMVNITSAEGLKEFITVSADKMAAEYDVTMQEAPQTPEEKQETALVISGFGDKIAMTDPQAAKAFWLESIKMMNIDGDVEQNLMNALQPQEDAITPQQAMQMQAAMQALQAQVQQLQAYIEAGNVRKTMADAALTEAKALTEQAKAVEVAESADGKAIENDVMRNKTFESINVTI